MLTWCRVEKCGEVLTWWCWWTVRVPKKVNDNPEHYRYKFTWFFVQVFGFYFSSEMIWVQQKTRRKKTATRWELPESQGGPGVVESRRLVGRLVGWWELVGWSLGSETCGGMVWERRFDAFQTVEPLCQDLFGTTKRLSILRLGGQLVARPTASNASHARHRMGKALVINQSVEIKNQCNFGTESERCLLLRILYI